MIPFRQQLRLFCLALAALLLTPSLDLRAEVIVVTGAESRISALSKNQVSDIFLGKVVSLPDGSSPTLVDQPDSSPLREEFYMKVANRSAAQARAHWAKLYFTGRGMPPRQGKDGPDVMKMVNALPGAIGYVDPAAIDHSVKVLFVVP